MNMFKSALIVSLGLVMASASQVFADATPSVENEQATVVFVRGAESVQTRSLNYNVYLGDQAVGRMSVNDRKEISVSPGEYQVMSNFYKGSPITVSLEAGKTYVIATSMKSRINSSETRFELVSDEVAVTETSAMSPSAGS